MADDKNIVPRVGIYAGSFNPVHAGHIAFALQALTAAKLDKIYFLPERRPRYKQGVEHFAHRVGMLKQALQPHPQFEVLELPDVSFTVERTLARMQRQFQGSRLAFLFGSDVALQLADWPQAEILLQKSEVIIGLRQAGSRDRLERVIDDWKRQPPALYMLTSFAPDISSRQIREALYRREQAARGLLASVRQYSDRHWLYVSLG